MRGLEPREVLDVGCGEGWLAHALEQRGVRVTGVDASEALVRAASSGPGRFLCLDYATLAADSRAVPGPFDAAVCNFALLDEDVTGVLRALRARLRPGGRLVVQTLHPLALGPERYADAWHEETFDGFGGAFPAAMPWFARTLASWMDALTAAGFVLVGLREPRIKGAAWPVSLLLVAAPSDTGETDD